MNRDELLYYINTKDKCEIESLFKAARKQCDDVYGKKVFFRGLIEFTNYCKNDCYYCGIQKSNKNIHRYRLTKDEILECCKSGEELGFNTFVLQGGEDPFYNDDNLIDIIRTMRNEYPDVAITLSFGERSKESYKKLHEAGANRYLLRHESANDEHYNLLHPEDMKFSVRRECLYNLKEIGFQTGAGMMVGSPYQTSEMLLNDLLFLKELQPEMVGVGPFIASHETKFADFPNGDVELTLKMVALTRLILPNALLPATTALGTVADEGRERALMAGANVIMPNMSPLKNRKDYSIYDNKKHTGLEASESIKLLFNLVRSIGLTPSLERGDFKGNI